MRFIYKFILLSVLLFLIFILDLSIGSIDLSVYDIIKSFFSPSLNNIREIVNEFRMPRVMSAILSGISLPISGLLLQTLFSNPLAGPYIFGISSGAGLGVAIVVLGSSYLGFVAIPGSLSISIAAIIGALSVLLLIMFISMRVKNNLTILVIGVFLGSGISAIISLMQYLSEAELLKNYVIWTMGSLDNVSTENITIYAVVVLIALFLSIFLSKNFDGFYVGEDSAKTLGINVKNTRLAIFVLSGTLTGLTTAMIGPVGFVGIAIPHIVRFIFKENMHLKLIILSAITGAIVMLLSDIICHIGKTIIPLNTITALWGIPIILWIVLKNKSLKT